MRERTGWGDTQPKVHLARLVELELLVVHRGTRSQRFVYELVCSASAVVGSFLPGLIDAETLESHPYESNRSGQKANRSGAGRGAVGWGVGG